MVNWGNYEEYMLLHADGELNEAEQKALQAFIALHPELQKEYELYSIAHFVPDTTQVYQRKEQLLKQEPQRRTIAFRGWWAYSAAAGIAAIIGIWALKQPSRQPVVVHNTPNNVAPVVVTPPVVVEEKGLHSSPVKTITTENKKMHQPTAIAKTNKVKNEEQNNTAKITQPVIEPKEIDPQHAPETIAQVPAPEKPVQNEAPVIVAAPQPEVLSEEPKTIGTRTHRLDRDVLALLDLDEAQGLTEFKSVVSEKLEKAKDIKNKIKGTDVSLRLGNKEIFVLKF